MKTWKLILAVLVIFGAGVVTGGLLVRVSIPAAKSAQRPANANSPNNGGSQMPGILGAGRQQFVQRLNRQLELRPDQSSEVDRIMEKSRERMLKIWDPIAPQAREETRNVRTQIYALLDDGQKVKFDENFRAKKPREQDGNKLKRNSEATAFGKETPRAQPALEK